MDKLTSIRHAKTQIDLVRLRQYRLNRVREQLREFGYGAIVLFNPINVRYATGVRNMQITMLEDRGRYVFVPTEGPVTLFEFPSCEHLSDGIETVDEVRETVSAIGYSSQSVAKRWAREIAELMRQHAGKNEKLAVDDMHPAQAMAIAEEGIQVVDGQEPMEYARCIKNEDEIEAMKIAMRVADIGMVAMKKALVPGITENELWSHLHQTNIAYGGDYLQTRLLNSGHRTNPWYQECSDKVIQEGELVSFDTDMHGPFGYYADVSRAFYCGDGEPTDEQKRLYQTAYEQIQYNTELLKPGMTFKEAVNKSWRIPDEFMSNLYFTFAHGSGLSGEYPFIIDYPDFEAKGYDGVIKENMILSLESYIGAKGGKEGVKLEEQFLITKNGPENLSEFPFEEKLLK